ncbi:MAG: response regulator [Stellaceae bacterium]
MNRPRHILVVDDNGAIRGLLTAALEERGDRVTSAAGGVSMRDVLSRDRVDVVVLDVRLPGEDGHALALHAQALGLPVVLISGGGEAIGFAERNGLTLLRKPFRMPQLFDALDAAVAGGLPGPGDAEGAQ